ncbi:ribonuclease Z [Lebetimonas natsushimae]|uniref:Ribonuclease Z n=1 Tax=Lebetimonas natsushimae TaxID=1936991 RepID=A0A292YBW7_9BACT|nr:ribonuclease Z [Lebetimonas natsushimae]GAX87019.1 ribonuclease Z [Lebetimonas natsushimae]
MKFIFFGTSAGRPTKQRNVSALAMEFENDNKWYLFDCGEATQHQILKSRLSSAKLDTIFITHLHGDHVYGLFGLITSRMLDKITKPLTIYGPKGLKDLISSVVDIRFEHLGYKLIINEIYAGSEIIFDKFRVTVLPLMHSVECFAYYIKENDKSNKINQEKLIKDGLNPCALYGDIKKGKDVEFNGKKYKAKDYLLEPILGQKVIISGDNAEPEILCPYLENLDLLIHESTYIQDIFDNMETKYMHTTAKNLAVISQKYNIKNLIATHVSPRFTTNEPILNEIKQYYNGNAFVANDFDEFELKGGSVKLIDD